ncbi:DUF2635 domain-containing protein [Edwardsiella piscicida]|uniref:DUF2635 domain-containing protein n=1 Tax=Edwardsiella piscicida TaxID=1263550 RepID=UPI00101AC3A8|nr:DUF2635 domain-containing protein [Edwardsiella piscicida]ELM3734801.1 DUF2635 domain-containing protein [Edwardsiella piscicida]QBB14237.1 DUF2635 domain-containing protein [Edwardsiella piscicida]WGS78519.1 DUF2635 domain-containing protein [Edwardsiella piscicida]WGS81904.1 DUF2635 domain-containing protein [Edwardsiella piscicida]
MMRLIKPAREGVLVRKANGDRLESAGETLPLTTWWYRREAEGDVTITDVTEITPEPVVAKAQKSKSGEK